MLHAGAPAVALDSSSIVGSAEPSDSLHTYTLPGSGANGVVPGPATKTTAVPSSEMSTSAPVIGGARRQLDVERVDEHMVGDHRAGDEAGRTYRRISEPVDHTIVEPSNDSAGAAYSSMAAAASGATVERSTSGGPWGPPGRCR